MAELNLRTDVRQERREYNVQEIFRLAERFRHLAKDLSEVFIQSSRQGIIHQIEVDPEEAEMKERLGFVSALSKRLKARRQRREFKKLSLVKAEGNIPRRTQTIFKDSMRPEPTPSKVSKVVPEASTILEKTETKLDVGSSQAKPSITHSLLDAAKDFNARIIDPPTTPLKEEEASLTLTTPLQLSPDELPRYKKYADIGQQLLDARQLPHFRTLIEKARSELSPVGVQLLEDLAKKAGFN